MALSATEKVEHGYVIDKATGALVTTTSAAGAAWFNGARRDPDGRLVVKASA